jgi:spermidine/putrescine transport system ATP-binding protein
MADTIAVMNAGKVEQLGSPVELYERPASRYVANFLGQSNCLEGTVQDVRADETVVGVRDCLITVPGRHGTVGAPLSLGVRPEKTVALAATEHREPSLRNGIPGTVTDVSFTGLSTQYLVRTAWGQEISVFAQNAGGERRVAVGESVVVAWRAEHTFPLDVVASPAGVPGPAPSTMAGAPA